MFERGRYDNVPNFVPVKYQEVIQPYVVATTWMSTSSRIKGMKNVAIC
jgi:hypothetical protein